MTPKLTARPEYLARSSLGPPEHASAPEASMPRGRGRPPKTDLENEARDVQQRMVAQKKRTGGPGMDRGGATLVNDKRRRVFIDSNGVDEELVDAED